MNNEDIDIYCVTESWLTEDLISCITFKNYNLSTFFCRNNFKNGGTLILIKNDYKFFVISEISNLNIEKIFEVSAVELVLPNETISVVCVYRSPSGDSRLFFDQFELCLNLLFSRHKNNHKTVICGDFNIDSLQDSFDCHMLEDLLTAYDLRSVFKEPTRITANSATAIDYIITNFNNKLLCSDNIENGLSDHTAQLASFAVFQTTKPKISSFRSYSVKKINEFCNKLSNETWQSVLTVDNVNKSFSHFLNIITVFHESCFKVVKKISSKDNGWITNGLRTSAQNFKLLCHMHKLKIINPVYFYNYKNLYKKLILLAKKNYVANKFYTSSNKSKAAWNIIRNISKTKNNVSNSFNINNQVIDSPDKIAEAFNDHFIGAPLNLKPQRTSVSVTCPRSVVKDTFFLAPATEEEVLNSICSLSHTNTTGPDNLPLKVVKAACFTLVIPLLHIINLCFQQGTFPDLLKMAKVIALNKKQPIDIIENYRPIALLSTFSKVFEKIIKDRFQHFIKKHNILPNDQHGFRKGRSTTTALLSLFNYIYRQLDKNNKVFTTYLDLSKAFDLVDHAVLLRKLETFGFRGKINNLIKSYLTNRMQYVVYNDANSALQSIRMGVPQGSILGPLLFLLYIADINECDCKFLKIYADDISFVISTPTYSDAIMATEHGLIQLEEYLVRNNLVLNQSKTCFMSFHNKTVMSESYLVKLNGKSIVQVENFKLLGLYLDATLTWIKHTTELSKKCSKNCFLLYRLRHTTHDCIIKTFYYSNFESLIRYCIIFWGVSGHANRVFIIQKRAIRTMFGLKPTDSCRESFVKNKIFTLASLYIYELVKFVVNNKGDFDLLESYHQYSTRHGSDISYTKHRTALFRNNPYYMGSLVYNKLPSSIKNIKCNKSLLRKVKDLLLHNAFYNYKEFLEFKF